MMEEGGGCIRHFQTFLRDAQQNNTLQKSILFYGIVCPLLTMG